jgi:hypothetical protein
MPVTRPCCTKKNISADSSVKNVSAQSIVNSMQHVQILSQDTLGFNLDKGEMILACITQVVGGPGGGGSAIQLRFNEERRSGMTARWRSLEALVSWGLLLERGVDSSSKWFTRCLGWLV